MTTSTTHRLHIDLDGQRKEMPHLDANQARVLVGAPFNLHHQNDQIIKLFDTKSTKHADKLSNCTLTSTYVMIGY